MTDESIADQLLRRKNELIAGWDAWVSHFPQYGEQCAVRDHRRGGTDVQVLSEEAQAFIVCVTGSTLHEMNDFSGPDYRTVVLDALDRCIAEAKDRGI